MGACCACCVCCQPSVDSLFVDDDPAEKALGVGFDRAIFKPKEWRTMRTFCNKMLIKQANLNVLFKRFLTHEEVYVREFRVRTNDVSLPFLKKSKILQEISDIFLPYILTKEFDGLDPAHSLEEVSFARFVIMGYIFCAQPYQDLIFDFFAVLRQRFDIKIEASIYNFNVYQVIKTISEELTPCYILKNLLYLLSLLPENEEHSLKNWISNGVKYPLLFFPLERFRVHLKRLLFGDKMWTNRKVIKSRLGLTNKDIKYISSVQTFTDVSIANETSAVKHTARSFLTEMDAFLAIRNKANLDDHNRNIDENLLYEEKNEENKIETKPTKTPKILIEDVLRQMAKYIYIDSNDTAEEKKPEYVPLYETNENSEKSPNNEKHTKKYKHIDQLSPELCLFIKQMFGYKFTKELVLCSELPYPSETMSFLSNEVDDSVLDIQEKLFDNKVNREFTYNMGTNRRAWVVKYSNEDGEVLRETWSKAAYKEKPGM